MRQASCDVLFYPITPVFFCSSDVTRPGGFVKKRNKGRNRAKKKYSCDVMQPVLMLNMLFQTTRCDSAAEESQSRCKD